ncbi:MAG: peptide MFS transporter [Bacteroidales bacterium]|nr:peptide MFS transporter [Bacteroidales bacterium]
MNKLPEIFYILGSEMGKKPLHQNRHPKGLYILCGVEMWERFSYYGMRALLILYLTRAVIEGGMGMSISNASLLYGFFTGFVYFTPLIGGWIADKWLGRPISIISGAILMAIGLFSLSYRSDWEWLYLGLFLLIIGNGLFKPNISVMVGELYPPGDRRKDSAFTYFYMGINMGALIAPFITGWAAVTYGYRFGFAAAGIGMIIGIIVFAFALHSGVILPCAAAVRELKKVHGSMPADEEKKKEPLTKDEKDRLSVILVLVLFSIFFWAGFEQAGSSLTIFANQMVNRTIGSFTIPTEWFQSLNPLFVVMLAPLFAAMWKGLGQYKKEPSIPEKMGFGMLLLGISFMLLWVATLGDTNVNISLWWLVGAYLLQTMGELSLSPIGLSMVSKLSPVRLASMMMGVWLVSSSVANVLGGFLAASIVNLGVNNIFGGIALLSLFLGTLLLTIRRWLVKRMHGIS